MYNKFRYFTVSFKEFIMTPRFSASFLVSAILSFFATILALKLGYFSILMMVPENLGSTIIQLAFSGLFLGAIIVLMGLLSKNPQKTFTACEELMGISVGCGFSFVFYGNIVNGLLISLIVPATLFLAYHLVVAYLRKSKLMRG